MGVLFFLVMVFSPCFFSNCTLTVVGCGAAWGASNFLLLPQQAAEDATLISVANDQTPWNLSVKVSGKYKYNFFKNFFFGASLDGKVLRNGRSVITDSNVAAVFTQSRIISNAQQFTDFSLNAVGFEILGGAKISIQDNLSAELSLGYAINRDWSISDFVASPLRFFGKARYDVPYFGASLSSKHDKVSVQYTYSLQIGTLYTELTENLSDTIVLRRIPRTVSNKFTLGLIFEPAQDFSLSITLGYANVQNHAIGRSRTYEGGELVLDLNNVLETLSRSASVTVTTSYKF